MTGWSRIDMRHQKAGQGKIQMGVRNDGLV